MNENTQCYRPGCFGGVFADEGEDRLTHGYLRFVLISFVTAIPTPPSNVTPNRRSHVSANDHTSAATVSVFTPRRISGALK